MDGLADPFSALKDIHLPLEPALWPPAPGWWILALIIFSALWLLGNRLWKYYRSSQPAREIRRQLLALDINVDQDKHADVVQQMSRLVRQFAISRYHREQVARLTGKDWLNFLDNNSATPIQQARQFSRGTGNVLGDTLYQKDIVVDLGKLRQFLIQWSKGA